MDPGCGQDFLVQVERNVGLELTLLIVLLGTNLGAETQHRGSSSPEDIHIFESKGHPESDRSGI